MESSCSDEQGNVVQSKCLIISRCPGVFTRTETKEENNTDHIGNRFAFRCRIGLVGKEEIVDYPCDQHRLGTDRYGVVLFKQLQLGLNNNQSLHAPCSWGLWSPSE